MSETMPDKTVHLGEYLQVVWRRRLLVLAIWLAVFGIVAVYTYTQPELYRLSAQLQIERINAPMPLGGIPQGEPTEEFYQTQYVLIRSRDIARKLYSDFQMDNWPAFQRLKNQDPYEVIQDWIRIAPIGKSHVVEVWMLWPDRQVGEQMINRVLDFYLQELGQRRQLTSSRAAAGLTSRVTSLERNITDLQSQIRAYRQTYGVYSEREQINFLLGRTNQTIMQLAGAREELVKAEAENTAVQEAVQRGEPVVAETIHDYLDGLRRDKANLERSYEVQKLMQTPRMGEKTLTKQMFDTQAAYLDQKIAEENQRLQKQRMSDVTQKLAQAKTNFDRLQAEVVQLEPAVKEYQAHQFELEGMEKQVEILRDILDALKKGAESIQVERATENTQATVVTAAEAPPEDDFYTPRYMLNLSLGLVVGLMVGVAGAFFAEYLNTTIRLPSDIQDNLNLPLLGFVPAIPAMVKSFANKGKIAHLASQSGPAEAYRSLRTELLLSCSPERTCRTVMVTSTNPREGKTTVASNLAITMAQAGYRVLLIDADLRKPSIHEIFGLENDHGLSTLLSETGEPRVYIRKTEVENLHVLPGGPEPVNPAELLGSRKMRTLMTETSERYDVVVVDSSPVLGVADANILATMVDAVILVIQASKAKRAHVIRARNQLLGVNARLVGAVLNNVRGSRGDYYYYRRYYTPTQIRGMAEQHVM